MNTRGRKIEFAEMANPHLRITGRITSKSTAKNKRALSLDSARLPHSEAYKKARRLSNAGQVQPLTPKTALDHGSKKQRPGPHTPSAEKATESDTSSLAENSPNQSKSCDIKTGRVRPSGRKCRPYEVMTESTVLNSPETEGGASTMSSPSVTMQTEQNPQESIPDETDRKRLLLASSSAESTPPVDVTTPVEPDTSKRSLRTNRSRDYKFLAGLCSENHLKRKFLESETTNRRSSDGNQVKSSGKNAKKARLEVEEKSSPETKASGSNFTKDDGVRTFKNKDGSVSNAEAENMSCPVTVKTEIDDETYSLIPSSPAVKLEETELLEAVEVASEVRGQSSAECSVKLEDTSDDVAQINSGEEEDTPPSTETNNTCAPLNSSCFEENNRRASSSAELKDLHSEADTKVSDIEPPQTDSQTPSKCPYKDPKLLCLIEKLNSGAKPPSCLSSPVAEVGSLLEERVYSEANSSHETSFEESCTPSDEVVTVKLEEMDVKPTCKELAITDDSNDHWNRSSSLDPSINGSAQHKPEPQEISRSRINARKSFELSLARAASASSSEGILTNSPPTASADYTWNSNIKLEKERKGRESRAASSDRLWNSDVKLEKERKEREKGKYGHPLKHFPSGEKCSCFATASPRCTSAEPLSDQKSVFVSHELDEYLASSPVQRESVQREPDEPEVDEIDGFTFLAFPSQNSLEKHMKKLNVNVLNMAASSSRRSADGLGFQSTFATSEAKAACRRKREFLLKSGKVKQFSLEALSELGLEIIINPSDLLSAEPSADESTSCTAKVTRRGIAKMGNEKRQPRKGKIYGRKVTGRFASKANIKYHVKKTSPDSIAQSNLKGKGQTSASLGAPPKKDTSHIGPYDMDWRPVLITMKMAITALRALSIESAADVPCNQTDCTCSGKKGMQPEYEPHLSTEAFPLHMVSSRPSCEKEHCRLGCICDSLKTPPKKTTTAKAHCGRPDCMFGCDCERLTRSKVLKLSNSESETSGREAMELINGCEPGTKKRKRRGWGIPIEEDLGFFEEQGNAAEGGQSLRKSNRIKERPQLQDFKKLRKMIYDDIYEWENEEQLRPKRRKVPKLVRREKKLKRPKFVRVASTGGGVGSIAKSSAPAALGRATTETAAPPVIVKTEPPTFEISDDDVKIVSPEARKNGRLEEVVPSVFGVIGARNELQKVATSENGGHLAPSTARESTMVLEDDLEEVDDTVTSCARTMIYKRKQGLASLVATQNFPQKSTDALHHGRSLSAVQEKFANIANASETKQRFSAATTKPSLARQVKENVALGIAKVPPSGVDIFTRSVILVKKETGRGKPEERKPAVVLNMSYNVPLEHCKESIASKVYGMWTEGLAVVGQSFEYENLFVEFLPKSDKEIQIPPHIRDTINPNDVHEITIRITKKRENRRNSSSTQKAAVSAKVPVPVLASESSEISLSGLKNFVSGGVFDSSSLALSNANRLATSCVLGPFAVAKSTVCAKTVFPPLPVTDGGLDTAIAATAALEPGSNAESCSMVSPETHSKGKLAVTSVSHESHTVHWKSTVAEEGSSEFLTVGETLSGSDEPLGLYSEVAQPVTVDNSPESILPGGSAELKKLLLAGTDLSAVDVAVIPSQSVAPSQVEVISGRKPSQEEDLEVNVMVASSDCSMPEKALVPSCSGVSAPSHGTKPSSNADPFTGGDQLVIANTFKINPKTFDSLPSTDATISSASTQPGFRLIGVSASKNSFVNSFRIAPSMVRPLLVTTPANSTGLIVSASCSLPRSGLVNSNKIHLAPPLSLPVAMSGVSSGATQKSTSFLVVPKTMVSSLVKTGSTATGSLLPAQQVVPGGCLLVTNSKVLKIGVPVCSTSSTRSESLLQSVAIPAAGKTNSSFIQVKPVNTSASGQQRMMLVSTAETANRPRPSASSVLKQGGTDVRQLATRFAGQSPAKDVIEIKDDSDEEKGGHDEEIDILLAEADGSNEAAILSEKLGIRLENFASKMSASTGQPGTTASMPPPTQAPQKQKRKQMHEEKAEFSTNVEITEGWVRIPAEENKADPAPSAVPSTALVPSTASVPSGQSVETEITVVEEEQDAPISSSQPSRPAAVQPNLYVELYKAITPYLKQTDKTKKKKISPLYITRKATQVIKRITEWQNVLLNDMLKERMIYDKLKKCYKKLTVVLAAAAGRESDLTSEPFGQQASSLEHPTSSTNPLPSERRRVPGPLRRKFRGISRKDEDKILTDRPQEASVASETTTAACDTVAADDAVAAVNAVTMGDAIATGDAVTMGDAVVMGDTVAMGDVVAMGEATAMENTVAMDNTRTSCNAASTVDTLVTVAGTGSNLDTIACLGESADAEQNADLVVEKNSADVSRPDESSDSSKAIKKTSDDHSCGNTLDISVGLSCDSVTLTCTLNENESLQETLASADCADCLQCTDFSDEVVTNTVAEIVESALTYE